MCVVCLFVYTHTDQETHIGVVLQAAPTTMLSTSQGTYGTYSSAGSDSIGRAAEVAKYSAPFDSAMHGAASESRSSESMHGSVRGSVRGYVHGSVRAANQEGSEAPWDERPVNGTAYIGQDVRAHIEAYWPLLEAPPQPPRRSARGGRRPAARQSSTVTRPSSTRPSSTRPSGTGSARLAQHHPSAAPTIGAFGDQHASTSGAVGDQHASTIGAFGDQHASDSSIAASRSAKQAVGASKASLPGKGIAHASVADQIVLLCTQDASAASAVCEHRTQAQPAQTDSGAMHAGARGGLAGGDGRVNAANDAHARKSVTVRADECDQWEREQVWRQNGGDASHAMQQQQRQHDQKGDASHGVQQQQRKHGLSTQHNIVSPTHHSPGAWNDAATSPNQSTVDSTAVSTSAGVSEAPSNYYDDGSEEQTRAQRPSFFKKLPRSGNAHNGNANSGNAHSGSARVPARSASAAPNTADSGSARVHVRSASVAPSTADSGSTRAPVRSASVARSTAARVPVANAHGGATAAADAGMHMQCQDVNAQQMQCHDVNAQLRAGAAGVAAARQGSWRSKSDVSQSRGRSTAQRSVLREDSESPDDLVMQQETVMQQESVRRQEAGEPGVDITDTTLDTAGSSSAGLPSAGSGDAATGEKMSQLLGRVAELEAKLAQRVVESDSMSQTRDVSHGMMQMSQGLMRVPHRHTASGLGAPSRYLGSRSPKRGAENAAASMAGVKALYLSKREGCVTNVQSIPGVPRCPFVVHSVIKMGR